MCALQASPGEVEEMRRSGSLVVIVAIMVVSAAPSAFTITNGVHDTEHRGAGALLYRWGPDEGGPPEAEIWQLCSGSLIAPTIFLTAAHCVAWGPGAHNLFVSFDADLRVQPSTAVDPAERIGVTGYETHPGVRWGGRSTAYNDVAVVFLAEPAGVPLVDLPTENLLGRLAAKGGLRGHSFVSVGYGVGTPLKSWLNPRSSAPFDGWRWMSTSPFVALTPYHLHLLGNANATGEGGSCFGDSGGPKYLAEGSNTVVAVMTSSDPNCQALSQSQRLDTPEVRAFLARFVPLP